MIRSFCAILRKVAGLIAKDWTPCEMQHSFVSNIFAAGVQIEEITRLVGQQATEVTENLYWHQILPSPTAGVEALDKLFPEAPESRRSHKDPLRGSQGVSEVEPPIGIEPMTYSLRVQSPVVSGSSS
ncbi:hypothetical protein [Spirillospora sp. CA-294931]|uniref:hypothetical protein n=1 Tax=Spirillospora sp. CA-294931 TaxID=3240042 RepID=UPI003D8DE7D5